MFPSTVQRVEINTCEAVNERIRQKIETNLSQFAAAGPAAIDRRLAELDREWDIERCLETMAPTLTLSGLFLGLTVSKKWLVLPAVVQGFFLQHALQGWCPPIPVLRRLGVRTIDEINQERFGLKALRGDFQQVESPQNTSFGKTRVGAALAAVRK